MPDVKKAVEKSYDELYRYSNYASENAEDDDVYKLNQIITQKHPRRILDIGCGRGRLSITAAKAGIQVVATDISHKAVLLSCEAVRSSTGIRIDGVVADAFNLPFRDNSFDAALMFGVMDYFEDKRQCFLELKRTLAPGGEALYTVRNKGIIYQLTRSHLFRRYWTLIWRSRDHTLNKERPNYKAYDDIADLERPTSLRHNYQQLQDAGLLVVKVWGSSYTRVLVVYLESFLQRFGFSPNLLLKITRAVKAAIIRLENSPITPYFSTNVTFRVSKQLRDE